ncbi:MAG: cellulase family glycosylhydrolase [Oscillochloris sp.]|nr:cellulase family glycosylhydrolase [Oscillochloris sp.]
MGKTQLKLIIWAVLLSISMALASLVVGAIANLLAYFERGAEPATVLNIVPNRPPELNVALAWEADDADTGRVIASYTRSQVEATYVRSWLQWNLSYLKGEPHGLKTYFTGPALAEVSAAVQRAHADGLSVEQVDTTHNLQLHFYSADGAVISFTDHNTLVAQVIRDSSGTILTAVETRADYDVVMLLEDGLWHVRHWVRRTAAEPRTALPAFTGLSLRIGTAPYHIAGMNYYPQNTPWDTFWPQYNAAVIDRDLSRMKGLGLNTIRIFVPYEQFGGPNVDKELISRLEDLLDRAEAQGLKVIVTLFDFRADYSLLHWPDADRHLETLLTHFREHPAILAWDLKNEPDLDDDAAGSQSVDAWLSHLITLARSYDPDHFLTIGWSNSIAAQRLADQVDIVQFHYYAPVGVFASSYAELRAAVPHKPLLLGEFGLPTWNSVFPHGHTEAEQADYYAALLAALRASDASGYVAWTLYDFTNVPATVAGRWPWQTGPQRHLGVLRANGEEKPAAALLAPQANLDVPPVPSWARWLKPFWLLVFGGALGISGTGLWWWRRRRPVRRRAQAGKR